MFVILNGQVLADESARISPYDKGFLLGDGFFTTLLAKEGKLEYFDAHLKRLKQSAKIFSLPEPSFEIQSHVLKILDLNQLKKDLAAIRITITRGISERGLANLEKTSPTILITAQSYKRPTSPLKMCISSIKRDKTPPLCHIKHLGYQASILARLEASEKGYEDALMLNSSNNLVCSTSGNLFLISRGEISTPPLNDGALPGIMREKIIQQHKNIKIRSLTIEDIENADSAFITNSLVGIQMISALEKRELDTKININLPA